jgi:hypothetical protein
MDPGNREACNAIWQEHRKLIEKAAGSSHNHQAWPGGYLDHVVETMNIAVQLYECLGALRPLPFSMNDALLVMFLHDLEKPWKGLDLYPGPMAGKPERRAFRDAKVREYVSLTDDLWNALRYVEGEGDDYSSHRRVMGPLAAFCHMCDVASARIWPEHPLVESDPWHGAKRSLSESKP